MTIQLASPQYAKSKAVLQEALNDPQNVVRFQDPGIFSTRPRFDQRNIENGESFSFVFDPQTRRRFGTVKRDEFGMFKVT